MKVLVVFDSLYGNTHKVAKAVAETFDEAELVAADKSTQEQVKAPDVLIVGSPVHGGKASEKTQTFLQRIPPGALKGKRVAAFDTRMSAADQGWGLKLLMKLIDYAAPRIASALEANGGERAVEPAGFIVEGREGPLRNGELKRAREWARTIIK